MSDVEDERPALQRLADNDPTMTALSGAWLDDGVSIAALAKVLEGNTNLTLLDLSHLNIGDAQGAAAIATVLERSRSIAELRLEYSRLGDAGAIAIAKALERNNSLVLLDLTSSDIGQSGAAAIAKALELNSSIVHLDLSSNDIGDGGAAAMAKALECNSSLSTLALGGNNISNAGAIAIAKALERNSSLASLALDTNAIYGDGMAAIGKALELNTGLEKLELEFNMEDDCIVADECTAVLLKVLRSTSGITALSCGIPDDVTGADGIGQAIADNRSLLRLTISGMQIASSTVADILQGVARGNHLAFLRLDFAEVVNDADGRDAIPDELRANSSVEGMELVFDRDGEPIDIEDYVYVEVPEAIASCNGTFFNPDDSWTPHELCVERAFCKMWIAFAALGRTQKERDSGRTSVSRHPSATLLDDVIFCVSRQLVDPVAAVLKREKYEAGELPYESEYEVDNETDEADSDAGDGADSGEEDAEGDDRDA